MTYINGRLLGERGRLSDTVDIPDYESYTNPDYPMAIYYYVCTLEEDEYFTVGDNMEESIDSRSCGPIKRNDILNKVVFTVFPFSKFGPIL